MADKYLDTTLYTYAATPTWGTAQEGDGTATGAATPATMSLDMTGWTFTSGSSTFSVMGCTALTVGAGANSATNAQYSATLTTMIDNMVAAINLATALVVNTPTGWVKSQVRNTVFARRTGNSLELMTRAGSAGWNTLTAMTFTNVTGSSSGTWTGGTGGAWGWLFNVAAIWPSAIAVGAYGLWAATLPLAGKQDGGDVVYIRANNQTITFPANTAALVDTEPTLGATAPVTHVIDSGNKWSGDSATAKLTVSYSATASGASVALTFRSSGLIVAGKKIGTNDYNLEFAGVGAASGMLRVGIDAGSTLDGFRLARTGSTSFTNSLVNLGSNSSTTRRSLRNGFISHPHTLPFMSSGGAGAMNLLCESVVFDNAGNVSQHAGVFSLGNATNEIRFAGCAFTNFVTGSRLIDASMSLSTRMTFTDTVGFSGVTKLLRPMATSVQSQKDAFYIAGFSRYGTQDFWLDTFRGAVMWNGGLSQPVLNATLLDGVTKWSWLVAMPLSSTYIGITSGFETPPLFKKNTLASGARSFTVEFCLSSLETWTRADIELQVRYRNASGDVVLLNSYDPTGAALTTSTSTWSAESGGQVLFSDGGTLYHNKYKLVLNTPAGADLPVNEVIEARLVLYKAVTNATRYAFIDPNVEIA